jgi:hypothetical protein
MDPPLRVPVQMEIMDVGSEDDEDDVFGPDRERVAQVDEAEDQDMGQAGKAVLDGDADRDEVAQNDDDVFETPPPALTIGDVLDRLPKKKVGKTCVKIKIAAR